MSTTLASIWSASPKSLRQILAKAKVKPSNTLGHDRIAAVLFHYKNSSLSMADRRWLTYPNFAQAMCTTSSVDEGLKALRAPFLAGLVRLYKTCLTAVDSAGDGVMNNYLSYKQWSIARLAAGADVTNTIFSKCWYIFDPSLIAVPEHITTITQDSLGLVTGVAIAHSTWRAVWRLDEDIKVAPIERGSFDPVAIMQHLLNIDLKDTLPQFRCFYLWSLYELIQTLPPNATLGFNLNKLAVKYDCGIVFGNVSETTQGGVDIKRPPTRADVLQRLMHL